MKKFVRFLTIILFLFIISGLVNGIFEVSGEDDGKVTVCVGKKGYERYKCQVDNFCKKEEYGKNKTKIYNPEKDFEKDMTLDEVKELYTKNQNGIYKCGLLDTQKRSYKNIKDLTDITDKSGKVKTKISPKVDQKLSQIDRLKSQNKCNNVKKEKLKKVILDQATFESCKYKFYLQYMFIEKKDAIDKKILEGEEDISFKKAAVEVAKMQKQINEELKNVSQLQQTAYNTFGQYDDYYETHARLGLIKDDMGILRDGLGQTLTPVNQTTYKVPNAQNP